jgi:hypothetical protein|tara:strand:+ start:5182 stop:5361 length:180 start_codon:yes stop_codon:yes gene_type:complete
MSENYVKEQILLAMYRSVDRQNLHIANANHQSAEAEKWLQVNLRHNFNEVSKKEINGKH